MTDIFKGTNANYVRVIPNSQFFNSLEQIVYFVEISGNKLDTDYLLTGLRNTAKMYKLKKK